MDRRILAGCLAVIGVLAHFRTGANAQPALDGKPGPNQGREMYVIMNAQLYEVDEAFHNRLLKARWRSKEEQDTKPLDGSLFALLEKQKPFLVGKEINIDPGKQGELLSSIKTINYLPTPDQLRKGKKGLQTVDEGFTLSAQVKISAERRFVHAKFLEKSLEIQGIEKVKVVVGPDKGTEVVGEDVFVKETSVTQARDIGDGGKFLLPLQYRPAAVRNRDHWLIAQIALRIYIEQEERVRRGEAPK